MRNVWFLINDASEIILNVAASVLVELYVDIVKTVSINNVYE